MKGRNVEYVPMLVILSGKGEANLVNDQGFTRAESESAMCEGASLTSDILLL